MTYSVKYKKAGSLFWKKLRKVKGDGIIPDVRYRYFTLSDETVIEIPMKDHIFVFDYYRFLNIKQSMELEAGQNIPIKSS